MSLVRPQHDPKAGFIDRIKNRLADIFAGQVVPPDTRYIHDGIAAQQVLEDSDQIKKYTNVDFHINETYPELTGMVRDPIHRVDYYERKGIFMNPWMALLGEKHGKLAKVGEWQHAPCNRETTWTRQRAAAANQQN